MFGGLPLVTFSIREPYPVALRLVQRTLMQHGLRASVEMDVALRIKQELGAGVAPCTILFVDTPALLLEGIVFHRGAALGIPQPVVISGNALHTEVFVHGAKSHARRDFPATVDRPLLELQARIVGALETIAEREGAPLLVNY
jgi:hypothetical protein